MTAAEIRAAIGAVEIDAEAAAWLAKRERLPAHAQRAHAVLIAPHVIATFHPCGHTSFVDYNGPPGPGRLSEAGCAMMARRWTWKAGGVTAPCPECCGSEFARVQARARARSGGRRAVFKVQKGPAWSQRLRDAEQSLKESLMPGECYFCGVDNAGSPVPCTSEKHKAMAPQARASFRDAMSGVGLGHAADWAAAEYERRTRLIASGVRVNLYWIDPTSSRCSTRRSRSGSCGPS